jgi:hypothetical protein
MVAAHQSGQHQGRMNDPLSEDVRAWHKCDVRRRLWYVRCWIKAGSETGIPRSVNRALDGAINAARWRCGHEPAHREGRTTRTGALALCQASPILESRPGASQAVASEGEPNVARPTWSRGLQ